LKDFHKKIDNLFAMHLSELHHDSIGEYNFKSDLKVGDLGEEFVKNFLINKGFVFLGKNIDNRFDLLMSYESKKIKYEIKTDVLLSKNNDTGNLVVEFESKGEPSGISVCEADYYVYYIPKLGELWNIKIEDLKTLIKENNFKVITGGDKGSETKMYLIKRSAYKKYFNFYRL